MITYCQGEDCQFSFFSHYLFQDVLSSAKITATVTFGGSYVAFGVP